MFSQLIKFIAASFVWKKYKTTLLTAACLFIYVWLVGFIHDDYLAYREAEGSASNLGFSFVIKWLAWMAGITIFFFYDSLTKKRKRVIGGNDNDKNGYKQGLGLRRKNGSRNGASTTTEQETAKDPFAAIREKKTLRSKGDLTISNKAIDDKPRSKSE